MLQHLIDGDDSKNKWWKTRGENVSENSHFPSEVKTVHAEAFGGHLHLQYHMVEKGAAVSLTVLSQQIFARRDFLTRRSHRLHSESGPIYESEGSSRRVTVVEGRHGIKASSQLRGF